MIDTYTPQETAACTFDTELEADFLVGVVQTNQPHAKTYSL